MKNSNEDIYSRIRKEREKRGWSQTELGQRMNEYSKKTFPDDLKNHYGRNDIENLENHRKIAKERDILTLSAVFNLDCHYLLTGIEQNNISCSSELGLSQKAIAKLKNDNPPNYHLPFDYIPLNKVINYLVENDCDLVFSALYNYLHADHREALHDAIALSNWLSQMIKEGKLTKEDCNKCGTECITILDVGAERKVYLEKLEQILNDYYYQIHDIIPDELIKDYQFNLFEDIK